MKKNIKDKSEIILITNDDVTFDSYYIENAIKIIKNSKKSFLVASYKNHEEINQLYSFNDKNGRFIQKGEPNFKANCFAMNSSFCQFNYLEDVGSFYTKLLPHYLADIEYSYRAIKKGYKVITNINVQVEWDTKSTGIHESNQIGFIEYLRIVFTNKYSSNPIHWTYFYFFTMKKKYLIPTLILYWTKFFLKVFLKMITNTKK